MGFQRALTQHRWLGQLLLVLMCVSALAPSVSRMVHAGSEGGVWQLLCRGAGLGVPVLEGAQTPAKALATAPANTPQPEAHQADCPLCWLHHTAWAPAPNVPSHGVLQGLSQAVPSLFLHAPKPLYAWATPHSRGPPSLV